MVEKKKIFIDAFNKKADDNIKLNQQKVANYIELREKAISLNYPISLSFSSPKVSFTTLGELFAWVYPKDGGSENIPDTLMPTILPILAGKDGGGSELYKGLHKTYSSKERLQQSEEVKAVGGEKWFDSFITSAITKMAALNQKASAYKTVDDFEDAEHLLYEDEIVNRPVGLINQLYDAFIEAGSQTSEKAGAASSINTAEKKVDASTKSPINEETPKTSKKEVSPVNPTETKKETTPEVSKTAGTVVAEKVEVPKEEKPLPKSTAINVNVENVPPKSTAINDNVENVPTKAETTSNTSVTNKSVVNDIKSSVVNSTDNIFSSFLKESENLDKVKKGEPVEQSIINSSNPTTINEENTSTNSSAPTSSTTNSTTSENKSTTLNKEETTSNINSSSLSKNKKIENKIENTALNQSTDIFSSFLKESENLDKIKKGASVESLSNSSPKVEEIKKSNDSLEVSKNTELIPPSVAPLSPEKVASTISNTEVPQPEITVQPVNNTPGASAPVVEPTKTGETPAATPAIAKEGSGGGGTDMTEVSNRLKRIERLLIGPLEVKIVQ